jgi:hypothetical protein
MGEHSRLTKTKESIFSDKDEKGFWEVLGYSNSAFPWEHD